MANVADAAPRIRSGRAHRRAPSIRGLLAQTEIDLRLFGMLVALAVILLAFHVMSGGKLIQPANMTTLAVQAAGIAIIATGMVLVIVSRNIDLSVGSLVGLISMTYALLMTDWFPRILGHRRRRPVPAGSSPSGSASASAPAIGGAPGLHHRLHRRALVHRHARRTAVDPRRSSGTSRGRGGLRPRSDLPAPRRRRPGIRRRRR